MIPSSIRTYTMSKNKGFSLDSCVCDSLFIQSANLLKCLILIQMTQDRLLLPIDRSDKVTCTKLQSFIEELKQLIYFTTHMVIVVITKLTFQIVSTGDGGSSWRPRCHQRLSRLLLLQYHWLQFYCKRSLSFLLSKLIHVSIFLIVTRTLETAPPHHLIYFKCIQAAFLLRAIFDWHFFKNS